MDEDHVGGLVSLVTETAIGIGEAWMHVPSMDAVTKSLIETKAFSFGADNPVEIAIKNLRTARELYEALGQRSPPVSVIQPVPGSCLEYALVVCGPPEEYLETLRPRFKSVEEAESFMAKSGLSAANNSSVILNNTIMGNAPLCVFTADAGVEALKKTLESEQGIVPRDGRVAWMQIPHHGSVSNLLTDQLMDRLAPQVAFVSAGGGAGHPSDEVIESYRSAGAIVYGTCWPRRHLLFQVGTVPPRPDYSSASPIATPENVPALPADWRVLERLLDT